MRIYPILFELEDLPWGAAKDFADIKTALLSKGKPIGPLRHAHRITRSPRRRDRGDEQRARIAPCPGPFRGELAEALSASA